MFPTLSRQPIQNKPRGKTVWAFASYSPVTVAESFDWEPAERLGPVEPHKLPV